MFARITIQSGIAAGTSHVIQGRVARVGSDPDTDVCLPTADIPSHALTLEFRDEGCRVYNRCRNNVLIGSQLVQPDQIAAWSETDVLQLGNDTELLLDYEEETDTDEEIQDVPQWEQDPDNIETGEDPDQQDAGQAMKGNKGFASTVFQLVVTAVCLAGCVLLLVRDQNLKAGPDSGPGFTEIISTALVDTSVSPILVQRIQYAEAQRIRGRKEFAQKEFQSIRNDLPGSELVNQNGSRSQTQILRFLQTRLAGE